MRRLEWRAEAPPVENPSARLAAFLDELADDPAEAVYVRVTTNLELERLP